MAAKTSWEVALLNPARPTMGRLIVSRHRTCVMALRAAGYVHSATSTDAALPSRWFAEWT